MTNLFLDFETKDRAMGQGLGAGWCYAGMLDVIGFSYAFDSGEVTWSTDVNELRNLVNQATEITCHNAQYDIGILNMLGVDYSKKRINCTMLLSKLHFNGLNSYSLDYLSTKWFGTKKLNDELGEIAKVLGLVKSKSQDAGKIAKRNMDILYESFPHKVIEYANKDVELTRTLYDKVKIENNNWLSDLIKCVIDIRSRGVLVSLPNLYAASKSITERINESKLKMEVYLQGSNPNSSKQLGEVCVRLGIEAPTTDKGNPSFNKKSCASIPHPLFKELETYKTLQKLKSSFIDSTLESLRAIYGESLEDVTELRVHPELHIFGAVRTGRFSSSNPNIQQIPKHNELGKQLVRSIFIPENGDKWYCLDFSAQEPRMQVHFSSKIGSDSGKLMALEWSRDPEFDMHQYVAKMMGVDRKTAKIINLGLSYGMGSEKLAASLGVSIKEAVALKNLYHDSSPYLKELTDAAKHQILKNGYIKTTLGRKLYKDPDMIVNGKNQDWSYKAINKLIQGSSADQTIAAMVKSYREGLKIGYPIHDEITISANNVLTVMKLKSIMETVLTLEVPSRTEVTVGSDFANQTKLEVVDEKVHS